jgi:type IV pilus assembly protein PilQ
MKTQSPFNRKISLLRICQSAAGRIPTVASGLLIAFCLLSLPSFSQDRFAVLETKLKDLSKTVPGLNEKVQMSVNGISIQDFVRGMAAANNLNVSVDPVVADKIFNNFTDAPVSDVLIFLCKKYELDIAFIGNIMSISKFVVPPPLPPKYQSKQIKVSYEAVTGMLSMDLTNDSLVMVAKELTRLTGKNLAFAPDLGNKMVSGFMQSVPFSNAMEKLAFSNDLKITPTDDNFYLIEKRDKDISASKNPVLMKSSASSVAGLNVKYQSGTVSVDANNVPIADIVEAVSKEFGNDYFLFTDIKGNSTLKVTDVTFDKFLMYVLNGTEYTFKKQGLVYLLGDRNLEGLRQTKLFELKYRTAEKITDFIPAELKKGVDIKIFPDLNALILSGSQPRIEEIENFLFQVDRVVPVVMIQVLIANVSKSHTLSTGIEAGLDKKPRQTGGTVFPGVDMTLSSTTLNEVIDGINGFGVVNLGHVTPNFYVTLKLLETQGVLKLRSTPQLSTLNGNEAKMSIGETQYYLEVQNNVVGTLTPTTQVSQTYKSVNADLALTVTPVVSGDEQITLDIKVKQSSFTARISNTAPPGTITRDFQSNIRVKNGEMVMLGGLEENTMSDSGSGVPLLSRIPVIKWLFSSRTNIKSDNKLTIFIKPTVIY